MPIVTHAFENTAKEMAELWGVPEFRFVMMPHPLGSLTVGGISERAESLVAPVLHLLREGQPK